MKEILVIDRGESRMFWMTLKSGSRILFSETGEKGLNLISENVGLVFLNLKLPDIKGMEVLRRIRREYPAVRVIVIASCLPEETCSCMEAFREGACDYVRPPLEAGEILSKIGKVPDSFDFEFRSAPAVVENTYGEYHPDLPRHIVKGVARVRDFLKQNYSEPLTIAEACKMAMTSKTYFCRFFKFITGHSLRNYQNILKIQMAEELLKDRRLSVTEVALRLGYSDSNYFSTIYKKKTGISPRQSQAFESKCGPTNAGRKSRITHILPEASDERRSSYERYYQHSGRG